MPCSKTKMVVRNSEVLTHLNPELESTLILKPNIGHYFDPVQSKSHEQLYSLAPFCYFSVSVSDDLCFLRCDSIPLETWRPEGTPFLYFGGSSSRRILPRQLDSSSWPIDSCRKSRHSLKTPEATNPTTQVQTPEDLTAQNLASRSEIKLGLGILSQDYDS